MVIKGRVVVDKVAEGRLTRAELRQQVASYQAVAASQADNLTT